MNLLKTRTWPKENNPQYNLFIVEGLLHHSFSVYLFGSQKISWISNVWNLAAVFCLLLFEDPSTQSRYLRLVSNCTPQYSVWYDYLFMSQRPAFGSEALIFFIQNAKDSIIQLSHIYNITFSNKLGYVCTGLGTCHSSGQEWTHFSSYGQPSLNHWITLLGSCPYNLFSSCYLSAEFIFCFG